MKTILTIIVTLVGFTVLLFFLLPELQAQVTTRIRVCKPRMFDLAKDMLCGVSSALLLGGSLAGGPIRFCVNPESGEAFRTPIGFNLPFQKLSDPSKITCSEILNSGL